MKIVVDTKTLYSIKWFVLTCGFIVLSAVLLFIPDQYKGSPNIFLASVFGIVYIAVISFMFFKCKINLLYPMIIISLGTIAALAARACLFYFFSSENDSTLNNLILHIAAQKNNPFFAKTGEYSLIYSYIVFLVFKLPDEINLYTVKMLSVCCDLITAIFIYYIVMHFTKRLYLSIFAYISALFVPTMLLNGAFLGQNDSIWVMFCIASLYFAFAKKPMLTVIMYALAITLSFYAILFLPVFILFYFLKMIKIKDLFIIPLVYFLPIIPAVIFGPPILTALSVSLGNSSAASPSLYLLLRMDYYPLFYSFGLIACLTALLFAMFYFLAYINMLKHTMLIEAAFILTFIGAFLFPNISVSGFLIADILALTVFILNKKRWYVPFVTILVSFNCYVYMSMGHTYLFNPVYASLACIVLIGFFAHNVYISTYGQVSSLH